LNTRERGLPALNEARAARRRAIVFGKVRLREAAPQFWLWTVVCFAIFGIVYWRYSESELKNQKSAVLARQRAIGASIGKEGFALVERVEGWARELAESAPELLPSDSELEAITRGPGIYLRLRLGDVGSTETLRKAAQRSLRDGFTSCMFVGRKGDPSQGTPCYSPAQCEPGLLCNEWSVCAPPGQPFNLRLLYSVLRVLTPEWSSELENAGNDLAVRALEGDLDKVAKYDVPIGAEVVRRASYVTLVLDEDPVGGVPPLPDAEPKLDETMEQQLQVLPHFARVGIWDLRENKRVLALRAEANGRFVSAGQRRVEDLKTSRAQQRQANSCALAIEVKDRVAERTPGGVPSGGAANAGTAVGATP
jgi:hypothetical protein